MLRRTATSYLDNIKLLTQNDFISYLEKMNYLTELDNDEHAHLPKGSKFIYTPTCFRTDTCNDCKFGGIAATNETLPQLVPYQCKRKINGDICSGEPQPHI